MSEVVQLPIKKRDTWEDVYEGRGEKKRIIPNLKVRTDTGIIYVRKYKAGKGELVKSTGFTVKNISKARTAAEVIVADWLTGKSTVRQRQIDQICDDLWGVLEQEYKNKDRRLKTWEHDRTYLPIIQKYFGNCFASDIDEEFWNNWVRDTGRPLRRSLSDIAKYLSKVLTYAYQKKYISRKPKIKNPDKPKKSGRIYENSDIELFIKHADPMLRDLIIIGAECGLRPNENQGLQWDCITFEQSRVLIYIPDEVEKRERGRIMEASDNVANCLRRRFTTRTGPYVFPAPKNVLRPISTKHLNVLWRRTLEKVNKELIKANRDPFPVGKNGGVQFRWLRHSFFTKALLDAKEPLAKVASYGGNSDRKSVV